MSLQISVVMPCYNAAQWLPETLRLVSASLANAQIKDAEIIVVDDGSSDGSAAVAKTLKLDYPVVVIEQANAGRFLARKVGVLKAQYENIFFVDTRVHIDGRAMSFVAEQLKQHPERRIWNGHVHVAKAGNVIARFGDAITFIGWRRYFGNPKTTSYGLEDFDHYPKGTGCFFVPKSDLLRAIEEFESTTTDLRFSSDDTLMIRILARDQRINLSPKFACTYFARTTVQQFIKHSYNRGQFFVDGFLRKGTRFYYPLIGFYVIKVVGLIALIGKPALIGPAVGAFVILWLAELIVALLLRVPAKDALSLFALSPVFTVAYGLGLWRGLVRKIQP